MKVWYYVMNNDYSRNYYEMDVEDYEQGVRISDTISNSLNKAINNGEIKDYQVEIRK